MKHPRLHPVRFVAAAWLVLAAGSGWADGMTAPYYAKPAWDQQLPASTRFVVLSNWIDANFPSGGAAVLDRETALVWERSPSTAPSSWEHAELHCNDLHAGNRKGWRTPTLQELASLVDPSVALPGPALPAGHPFQNLQSSTYWSTTTFATSGGVAWAVFLGNGVVALDDKGNNLFVWCVRGGQGVDPQ
jgi:uncharacterized protein DUF1566